LDTACCQSRMWLKKPNPGLTRYLLRLPRSKLRIWPGLITVKCPLNKDLHNMGLIDLPISIACGVEDESLFHLLCDCPSMISLRMHTFAKQILSVQEYGWSCCIYTAAIHAGKWQIHCDSLILSFLWTFLLFVLSNSICMHICLFLVFQFFIYVVHILFCPLLFHPSIQVS
jgi:hypothetical protein